MIDDIKRPEPKSKVRLGSSALTGSTTIQRADLGPAPAFKPLNSTTKSDASFPTMADAPILPKPFFGSPDSDEDTPIVASHDSGHKPPAKNINLFGKWPISRKKFMLILSAIVLLLLVAGGGVLYKFVLNKPDPPKKVAAIAKPAPAPPPPIVSPLTGMTVDSKDMTTWPVLGVMIENSPDARPQSGLKQAGVVFEAIAEGGITRFLALYQEDRPANIGPVRSSRPYYLDWAMAFDASYAHVGGSPDALARIKSIGVHDMDQFYNAGAYRRVTTRYAPHNVYTTGQQLASLSTSKGWATSSFTPLLRKADKPYAATATPASPPKDTRTPANSIGFAISGSYYNVHYDYDPAANDYKRSEGGAPHVDAESKTQLTPKVVIALVMPYSLMSDGYHSQYNTQGTGKMYVFQDGTVITGTWSKGDPTSQFVFKDDGGQPLKLNAGQTWISVVGKASEVSYK